MAAWTAPAEASSATGAGVTKAGGVAVRPPVAGWPAGVGAGVGWGKRLQARLVAPSATIMIPMMSPSLLVISSLRSNL
jgi:hypothetical protein